MSRAQRPARRPCAALSRALISLALVAGPLAGPVGASVDPASACTATQVYVSPDQPVAGSTAVLFVHGFDSLPGIWDQGGGTPLTKQAAARPGITAWTFDYSQVALNWVTDPQDGPKLALTIYCLAVATGRPVVVVAHSMGGLATQFAVSQTGPDRAAVSSHVAEVVTIGTPFQGSQMESDLITASGALGLAGLAMRSACAGLAESGYQDPCGFLGLESTPAGRALMYNSPQIAALAPWPASLPVFNTVGDITETFGVGRLHLTVDLGDGIVSVASGTAHATAGSPFVATCQDVILETLVTSSYRLPCYHHNLPANPQIDAQVMEQIEKFAGREPTPAGGGPVAGRLVTTLTSPLAGAEFNGPLAISPGDAYLASGGDSTTIWPLTGGAGTKLLDPTYPGYPITDPVFSSDGSVVVTTGYQDRAWSPADGLLVKPGFPPPSASVQFGGTGDIALEPSDGPESTVYLYEPGSQGVSALATYALSGTTLTPGTTYPLKVQFDTDANGFAPSLDSEAHWIVGASTDGESRPVVVYAATGGVVPVPTTGDVPGPHAVAARFSPDGTYLAVSYTDRTVVYSTKTWHQVQSFSGGVFAFSPDGQTLAIGTSTGPGVTFYNVTTGSKLGYIGTAGEIDGYDRAIVYSPDGKYLAVAQNFTGIQVWALTSS
jgi:pimeloyl-ACP methyl ester carboxylesterase